MIEATCPKTPPPNPLALSDRASQLLKTDAPTRPAAVTALLLVEQVREFLATQKKGES